jgi:hypothetical protein
MSKFTSSVGSSSLKAFGDEVRHIFAWRDEIYDVTREQLTGGYAEYAVRCWNDRPKTENISSKRQQDPVVQAAAWQMLFEHHMSPEDKSR